MKENLNNSKRKSSYFKMDANLVSIDEVGHEIREKWQSFIQDSRDSKINWDLAWGGVK